MTDSTALFTDVSVHPQSRRGVGVCLFLPAHFLDTPCDGIDRTLLTGSCLCQRFNDTSSTLLELETVLWGLSLYRSRCPAVLPGALRLYTDSQCVAGLSGRRESLEGKNFSSLRTGLPLAQAQLYREFFTLRDELGFEVVKLVGHSRAALHDNLQRIFSVVDRSARSELKGWLNPEKSQD
jgi:ribonuclease HI